MTRDFQSLKNNIRLENQLQIRKGQKNEEIKTTLFKDRTLFSILFFSNQKRIRQQSRKKSLVFLTGEAIDYGAPLHQSRRSSFSFLSCASIHFLWASTPPTRPPHFTVFYWTRSLDMNDTKTRLGVTRWPPSSPSLTRTKKKTTPLYNTGDS